MQILFTYVTYGLKLMLDVLLKLTYFINISTYNGYFIILVREGWVLRGCRVRLRNGKWSGGGPEGG